MFAQLRTGFTCHGLQVVSGRKRARQDASAAADVVCGGVRDGRPSHRLHTGLLRRFPQGHGGTALLQGQYLYAPSPHPPTPWPHPLLGLLQTVTQRRPIAAPSVGCARHYAGHHCSVERRGHVQAVTLVTIVAWREESMSSLLHWSPL